ncbi:baculoviral IAP repeat-containing protein 8-like [Ptychodera flava]|uniref:baculoviral IAP repeat-containing protein 8-like n=1 Tax=Ptychodera flava TaxID=63121 RepID=UPI003969F80A
MNEHRKYFPSCPFVRGEDVGNEPMRLVTRQGNVDDTPVKQTSRDPNRVENFQNQQQNQPPRNVYGASNTAAPQRSQTQSQHRHPEYADEDKRMATFNHWPSSDIVSSQELCRAGFYYTGIKDNVKCFHCDGGLRNWEPADEPWTEHARWFPKCEYILTERGSAFVNYVTSRYPRVPSSNPQASGRGQGRPQVNDVMRTDLVQVVLDMGYGKELVKKVVKRRINQTSESFRTTHDLLLAVWDEEEKMSRNRSHSDAQSDEEEDDQEDDKPGDGAAADPFRSNSEMSSSASALNSPEDLQRELETLRDQKTCKVCMDRDVCMLFQPCGHLVTCEVCSAALRKCPICRNNIRSTLRTYMS